MVKLQKKNHILGENPVVRWAVKACVVTFLCIIAGGATGVVVARVFDFMPLAFIIVTMSLGLTLIYMLIDFNKKKKGEERKWKPNQ
ncbi:MAG: hypothetical protein J7K94_07305 [Dehalococcoidia bacterium]|nr:hypothetical protein [Dehalococcoidia bacterium]